MTTCMLACGKANVSGSLAPASLAISRRYLSSTGNGKPLTRIEDGAVQRELFVNVLNANATRRDAKQYLARFKPAPKDLTASKQPQDERTARNCEDQDRLRRCGVNLGGLYSPARAIADSPQFVQQRMDQKDVQVTEQSHPHVALVCLRAMETIDDLTLDGLAVTLSQLVKLDMRIVLVLDADVDKAVSEGTTNAKPEVRAVRDFFAQQALRISDALERHNTHGGRFVTGTLEQAENATTDTGRFGKLQVTSPRALLEPLKRGVVPIIPSLAYSAAGQLLRASSTDVMLALTALMGGHGPRATTDNDHLHSDETVSLDRVIVLDPHGGIPSKDRNHGAHVFINLQQEFDDIEEELQEYAEFAERDASNNEKPAVYGQHRENLEMIARCLELLPSASSALVITPHEAASSAHTDATSETTLGAGTRRQRNSLIHNLLTNKPMVSSSLPTARLSSPNHSCSGPMMQAVPTATLIKRGMPVTITPPAQRIHGWPLPDNGTTPLQLDHDARIDFARLLHLIQDSFRRQLDVQHYLARIESRIAGIIVAGEYEGGAILTWEMPPGTSDPTRLVPYLDKFAVLQSSQGSSGVADIVFQVMVRTCFPRGVCWRSRKDNPVNKWYFERAAGSWQIPGGNWTMFWTGDGVVENEQRFQDYVAVCSSVKPSWADGKVPD